MSESGCGKDGSDPKTFELSEAPDLAESGLAESFVLPSSDLGSDILSIWARGWVSCFELFFRSWSSVIAPTGNCGPVFDDAWATLRYCLTLATCREQ